VRLQKFEKPVVALAKAAGAAIMEIYQDPTAFDVELKGDKSPLTAADKAANKIICDGLIELDAEIRIISEENKLESYAERSQSSLCWLVDPLDGTKEFIKRNGEFTVNIALIEDGRSVFGVVFVPNTGDLYVAAKGEGAFEINQSGRRKLSCRDFDQDASGLAIICSRSHLNDATQEFVTRFADHQLVPRGSSLKFTVLARGEADIYPRLGPTMEWDTAAAHILVEEAGGSLVHFETREPLTYNKEDLLNPNFIAMGIGELGPHLISDISE